MNILKYTGISNENLLASTLLTCCCCGFTFYEYRQKNNKNKLHKNKLNQFTNRQNTYFTTVVLVVVNFKKKLNGRWTPSLVFVTNVV